MREPLWHRLFPGGDFRWSMALRPGEAVDFFAPSAESAATLRERHGLLEKHASHYLLLPPGTGDLVGEMLELMSRWTGREVPDPIEAASTLEPDWVLLRPDAEGRFRVEAGAVCFPSHWSLPEKAGRTVAEVHGPVPQLNVNLGRQIDAFLGKLAPGAEWERENWGLSADDRLDHHPRLPYRVLDGNEPLGEVWLRLERQLFVRLPGGGLLFGIRVSNHRLDRLARSDAGLAGHIAGALRTMPEAAARYKGIGQARRSLAERLERIRSHP